MVYKREEDDQDGSSETSESSDFAKLLEQSFDPRAKRLKVGDKVQGEVLSIGRDHVIVSTGTPHDGFVLATDCIDEKGQNLYRLGDKVPFFVTAVKGTEIFLSPKVGARSFGDDIEDAYKRELVVEGKVEEVINGGFRILIMGKKAFCPVSQLDSKRIEVPESYLGKKFEFHVTQYSERGRNIVVSRRKLLDDQKRVSEATFVDSNKVGTAVNGTVSRIEKYGAFIELAPGIDGMVHISEISWSRLGDPSEALELGQQVTATILKIENDGPRKKISLSIKQSQVQPWLDLPSELKEGAVLSGKVTRCLKFGAFIELYPGIEGLVPMSEMSYTKRVAKSDELFKEGERISVKVLQIDAFARRIGLSFRDAEGQDPWASATENFKVGSLVAGTIERRESFGLLIAIAPGVVGLLPKSKAIESAEFGFERLKRGDAVKVRVSEVRSSERKISLDVPGSESGAEDWKNFQAEKNSTAISNSPFAALGSQIKAAFDKSKK